jgi:hypothetical protein
VERRPEDFFLTVRTPEDINVLTADRFFVGWNQEIRQKFCGGHLFLANS